jgi:hypothetical protein
VHFETLGMVAERPETFLAEVKKLPRVINASSMLGNLISGRGDTPGGGTQGTHSWAGRTVPMDVAQVNYDLIETLGIEIQAGRSFFVIALPVSYLIAKQWLDTFAFKVPLEWWYFASAGSAGVLALLIAWLTVGMQAFKAARVNPVRCLRDE